MKILVVGGGGREHAIVWALSRCRRVDRIYCSPGNAGIAEMASCLNINADDIKALVDFARYEWIDYTIVGPEVPLVAGIVDAFTREGLKIIGPTSQAARLEGSKVFAKDFMKRYGIPTAQYRVFTSYLHAEEYVKLMGTPVVIKADGLAAGKGVIVAWSVDEAIDAIRLIMKDRAFGEAGDRVVVEQCIEGQEASFMVFTDGDHVIPMVSAQDYKRAFDADRGPNTGGMGAITPASVINSSLHQIVMNKVIYPTLNGLHKEGMVYKGILYAGLMIKDGVPYVLEFNCRLGDPEAQAVLMRLDTDLLDIMIAIHEGSLNQLDVRWKPGASMTLVLASGGYPGSFNKGVVVNGLESLKAKDDLCVFHSGTTFDGNNVVTTSGRVLAVTAAGPSISAVRQNIYENVKNIGFDGMFYRNDIGA
ncbi:MAG: phosphoribosylamine--glycine ligase [Nitrospirae bacterium]|uniref:phosphoribosylamine--glycine ligase n=1 Tax=Candidatus Magnetobacterium casense TaxID=1455061 RepID=UPI00058BBAD7|nr:phosphoribosylamine--glycine ligase [Candidatus Magnetobacterium casensis]MBF0336492.1 phosphoribosylamine--glycine ligase [Nitrospirota bacterium]